MTPYRALKRNRLHSELVGYKLLASAPLDNSDRSLMPSCSSGLALVVSLNAGGARPSLHFRDHLEASFPYWDVSPQVKGTALKNWRVRNSFQNPAIIESELGTSIPASG